jgi:predicted PurR-regulated permease PerM
MDSQKTFSVNVTLGTIIKTIIVVLIFVAAYKLQNLILILLVAIIMATAIGQGTKFLARFKISRLWAVLILYIVFFSVIFIGISLLLPPLFNDLTSLASDLPAKLNAITQTSSAIDPLSSITGGLATSFSLSDLIIQVQKFILQLSDSVFSTASVIFGGVFSFILILVISFYLSVQERGIENFLQVVTPLKYEDYVLDLWKRTQNKIGLWLQGQLLLGLLVGFTVFIGLSIMGVKYALTLGLISAVFELIPFFGPILFAIPGVLLGFSAGPSLGLVVLIFYVIVQQLESHIIYPLVAKKVIGVPPLIVILALLAGAELYGFLGMVISVPLATVVMELTNDMEKRKMSVKLQSVKK